MMEINWKHDVHNDDLLNFRPLFPKYHPFLSLSLLSWWWWWQNTFFHFLEKQFHPHLNQVVPRQPYVGQRQQLPERTEGVATHFHHKVTFLKMMRMATIIIVITIVILNKSLSGKWRGRILGNTLAGASKNFSYCKINFVSTSWKSSNLDSLKLSSLPWIFYIFCDLFRLCWILRDILQFHHLLL